MKKSNGEGSIYFDDKRQRWCVALTVEGKRTVKRFKEKADADAWLALQRSNILNGNYIADKNVTLGEWILQWMSEYKQPVLREKTYIRYKQTAAHLDPIADIKLQNVDAVVLQKYFNSIDVSLNAKGKIKLLLSSALSKAVACRMIYYNPCDAVELPRQEHKEVEIFTDEEVKKVLEFLRTNCYYRRYYPVVLLAVSTGMRLGELLGLQYEDIKGDSIKITHSLQNVGPELKLCLPKTDRGLRTICVDKELIKLLGRGTGYVFTNTDGNPQDPSGWPLRWKRILKAAGIEPYRKFHCLRHTFISNLVAQGIPLPEISRYVGHAQTSFTLDVYTHAVATTLLPKIDGLLLPQAK